MKTANDNRFLREREVAELLGISTAKLRLDRLMGRGLPFVRIGRAVRYETQMIEAWLAEHRHGDEVRAGKVA